MDLKNIEGLKNPEKFLLSNPMNLPVNPFLLLGRSMKIFDICFQMQTG